MDPRPRRKRSTTATRDTISWKVRGEGDPWTAVLAETDIERIAEIHGIDVVHLRQVSSKLASVLSTELNLFQPDLTPARRAAGQKKLARVNDLMRSADAKLDQASKILEELGFSNPFAHGVPNATDPQLEEFTSLRNSLRQCRHYFRVVETHQEARFLGTPDGRKATDVRRTITCVTLFNFWLGLGRKLSYTTDTLGERTGPLIEFINEIVWHMTHPAERLSGEAIKRELEDFLR